MGEIGRIRDRKKKENNIARLIEALSSLSVNIFCLSQHKEHLSIQCWNEMRYGREEEEDEEAEDEEEKEGVEKQIKALIWEILLQFDGKNRVKDKERES